MKLPQNKGILRGEDRLIDWLTSARGLRLIGDDAAILPSEKQWAVTMDSQIEGTHFFSWLDPAAVARRLLAVNVSDLAAMGAIPAHAFLALSAPRDFDHKLFLETFVDSCESYEIDLSGGDLAHQATVTAVLTLLGFKPRGAYWLQRHNARIGDQIWVGGNLGEAALGLALLQEGARLEGANIRFPAHLEIPQDILAAAERAIWRQLAPSPQIDLGTWLGRHEGAAAIDVSDGLSRDLHRLCSRSGVGALLEIDQLPLSPEFIRLAHCLDRDWQQLALHGGEDYVLLFTLPTGLEPPEQFPCSRIGQITARGLEVSKEGKISELSPEGWDHLIATN